tara:strand:- start:181 stop:624 length:444 start_codon:yes stop_codon:yes gene_type:complete
MFASIYNYFFDNRYYYLSLIETDGKWHIHGLWPQYDLKSYPSFCNKNATFDERNLKSILNKLNDEWYSDREPNSQFWEHEWLKHGTCMFDKCNEYEYFKKALDLFDLCKNENLIEKNRIEGTHKSMVAFNLDYTPKINLHSFTDTRL